MQARSQFHVCTVATHKDPGLELLIESCNKQKISLDILGMGLPFRAMRDKLIYLQEYLHSLPSGDIVLFVDAFDVIFLNTADAILHTFFRFNAPFVIATERYCFPYPELVVEYPQGTTSFNYINSGTFIGYVSFLKEIITECLAFTGDDDQGLFTRHYFKYPKKYCFDSRCELFLPLTGVSKSELIIDSKKQTVFCKETATTPMMIHGNSVGSGRVLYQEIVENFFGRKSEEIACQASMKVTNKEHPTHLVCGENFTDKEFEEALRLPLESIAFFDSKITDRCFSMRINPLRNVILSNCSKITDRSIEFLATQPLLELTLENCPQLTDACLQHLSHLPLQSLTLSDSMFTDEGLQAVGKLRLVHLSLKGCNAITDTGFSKLLAAEHQLETLTVSSCKHLSLKGFYEKLATLKNLHRLVLGEKLRQELTGPMFSHLARSVPRMRIFEESKKLL